MQRFFKDIFLKKIVSFVVEMPEKTGVAANGLWRCIGNKISSVGGEQRDGEYFVIKGEKRK